MSKSNGSALMVGAKEILKTGQFSDLTIKAGNREWKVHRAFLFLQSSYFRSLLGDHFEEANANEIVLPESEDVIQALIHNLYHFCWDENANRGDVPKAVFCVHVYQVADKYDVPPLAQLAASRFAWALQPVHDVPSFVDAIYAVDECTNPKDRKLWGYIIPLIKANISHLLKFEEFKALIQDKQELTYELLGQVCADGTSPEPQDEEDGDSWGGAMSSYAGGGRRLG